MPAPATALSQASRDKLFQKYILTVHTGGTSEQRRSAFDRWCDAEWADIQLTARTQKQAAKRRKAKALSG